MLFGDYPYRDKKVSSSMETLNQMIKNETLNLEKNDIKISQDMKNLLSIMITYYPKDRITFEKLFKHKFFSDYLNSQNNDIIDKI